ncbi:cytochrome C oxidase assembly factor 3b [Larimichthys crocea]|uniref:cytochrome C oxidase assembly factor 3b n=1 Tax=Larimichthys crocea TaxID=215358 RepID=UPI000622DD67|nr:cytochrome c oxidase assembly factor 3 homolog, mitochondrial [Larimichthys crocea]
MSSCGVGLSKQHKVMAEKGAQGAGEAPLTAAQKQLLRRRQELQSWQKDAARLRGRNLLTGLTIGAFVIGVFSHTILSVRQDRIIEELDDEAKIHILRGPQTGANS